MFKEKLYQVIADIGIATMSKLFPGQFAKDPVKPSDRYLEYNFAISHLPKPPAKVIDVGCVSSLFPLILAGFGYDVTGIDIRDYPILKRLSFPNFKFIKHNICNRFDDIFDCVTAISTIEHLGIYGRYGSKKDDNADMKAITNIYHLLCKDGKFILTIPVGKYKILPPYYKINDWEHIEYLIAGFDIEDEQYYLTDKNGYWYQCNKEEAFNIKPTKDYFALGLFSLIRI